MSRRQALPTSVITLNTRDGASADNHVYPLRTPILGLTFGLVQVQITTSSPARVTVADVEFARQLAAQTHAFARAVERAYRRGVAA
ncbi:hypothetical protein ACIBHY_20060 [Nonomuraea sp. NPDC050547]|uniref:hypothetical protein n=1 Tax=Nonomuraea sp. NPDC050547 TaxID=3364368 RepID=UPI0037AE767E